MAIVKVRNEDGEWVEAEQPCLPLYKTVCGTCDRWAFPAFYSDDAKAPCVLDIEGVKRPPKRGPDDMRGCLLWRIAPEDKINLRRSAGLLGGLDG